MRRLFEALHFPIFLARETVRDNTRMIEVHTTSSARKGVAAAVESALKAEGQEARVVVHGHGDFLQPNTLETLRDRFGRGRIVYDPTGAFARMDALISCSKAIRSRIGEHVCGIFLEPANRTLYLVLSAIKGNTPEMERKLVVSATVRSAEAAVSDWRLANRGMEPFPIVAIPELPTGYPLIPVDGFSGHFHRSGGVARSFKGAVTAVLASLGMVTGTVAATAHVGNDVSMTQNQSGAGEIGSGYAYKADLFDSGSLSGSHSLPEPATIRVLDTSGSISTGATPDGNSSTPKIMGASVGFAALAFDVPTRNVDHLRMELAELMGPGLARAITDSLRGALLKDVVELAQAFRSGGYGGSMGGSSLN
ncbi:MAG: hypothetical protein KDJ48_09275 [Nitratireductor sp.]|nr:hypothetical protein [Nitratireductor sp.]